VPEFAIFSKKSCRKAQSPGIRGFGGLNSAALLSGGDVQALVSVPDAGSRCIESVHDPEAL
jgi:hypothetical protein